MSKSQAVKDAEADAETLRKLSRTPQHRAAWGGYLDYCANMGLRQLRDGGYPASWFQAAARAARAACPGLRGPEGGAE